MNCPKCSANNTPDAMFCAACGAPLNAAPPVSSYQPPVSEAPVVEPAAVAPEAPVNPYAAPVAPSYTAAPTYSAPQQYATYQQPYASVPQYGVVDGDASKNWAGITGMITGIGSILCCFTAFGGLILSIAAIIFGVMGLKSQKRGMAIAGLITGIVGIILSLIMLISYISVGDWTYYYDYYLY